MSVHKRNVSSIVLMLKKQNKKHRFSLCKHVPPVCWLIVLRGKERTVTHTHCDGNEPNRQVKVLQCIAVHFNHMSIICVHAS